ncbi:MAG: hypothetical protein ABIF40_00770 [archaeon]
MNKKGQLYIVAALILAFIIFGLMSVANQAREVGVESNFDKLTSNYKVESAKLVNSLLEDNANPTTVAESFTSFAALFTSYAKTQNPHFGLIYAFNFENNLYIGNYLDKDITWCATSTSCTPQNQLTGCFDIIPASVEFDDINLQVLGLNPNDVDYLACNTQQTGTPKKIIFDIGGFQFPFEIKPNHPEIIMVSLEETEDELQIYVGGELVGN